MALIYKCRYLFGRFKKKKNGFGEEIDDLKRSQKLRQKKELKQVQTCENRNINRN